MRNKRKYLVCFLTALCFGFASLAQNAAPASTESAGSSTLFWGLGTALLFAALLMVYLIGRMGNLAAQGQTVLTRGWWASFNARFFTNAIPLEKEADHLLDHSYDGIQELDNSLPPWWKYGFYITIVFSVLYILKYHVWKTGPDPEQEYNTEMAIAAKQVEEYRRKAGDNVDEKTVTLADAAGIAEGAKIFGTTCLACHGAKGEGGVGPNLTDKYWLHGGSINDVFKTIKYGVPEKGMQAWEKTYSPGQIKNIASYIKSIAGTNPPNAKAPQGEPFEDKKTETKTATSDSTSVAKK